MARNEVRVHASTKDDASQPLDNIRDKLSKLRADGAKGIGIGAAAGATTFALNGIATAAGGAAEAVIGFAEDSIAKASDLNETMSKAEVIFGKNSQAVEDWAATMDKSAGESKKDALDAASGFAGLFKTVGLGIDESTAKSEKLTQLGADLASFFNTDVGTALDALKSGLNGESEPLRQFNVFLSETAVAGELAKEGVKKVGGQFTEAQKATARYNLILQQTGDAQGDFARTSDGLANSQRVTAAEMDNLQAEIGQELLPVVKDLSNWAKDEGVPALKELIGTVKDNADGLSKLGTFFQIAASGGLSASDMGYKLGRSFAEAKTDVIDLGAAVRDTDGHIADMDADVRFASQSTADLGTAARDTDGHISDMDASANYAAKATERLTNQTTGLHRAYMPVITDLRTLKEKLDDATTAIEDDMFAMDSLKRSTEEAKDALKDDIKKLRDLEAIKHPTRAQREDINQTKDAIVDDKKKVIENSLKLLEMGKIKFPALVKQLHNVGLDILADTDAARALRVALYAADQAMGGRGGSGGHHGGGAGSGLPSSGTSKPAPKPTSGGNSSTGNTRNDRNNAAGGLATIGDHGWVGELGPERYQVTTAGVMFQSHQQSMASAVAPASAGLTINGGVHIHGVGSDVSEAAAGRFGQQVLDEVVRGFRDQSARTSRVTGGRW